MDSETEERVKRFQQIDSEYKDLHSKWVMLDSHIAQFWRLRLVDASATFLHRLLGFYEEAQSVCDKYGTPSGAMTTEIRLLNREIKGAAKGAARLTAPRTDQAHKDKLELIMDEAFDALDAVRCGV